MEALEGSRLARLRASVGSEVFLPTVLAILRLILVHDHIEHLTRLVPDTPMAADIGVETYRRVGLAAKIAAGLDLRRAVDLGGSVAFPIGFRPSRS